MLLKNEMVEIRFSGSDICMVSISHRNKDNTVASSVPGSLSDPGAQLRYEDLGPEFRKWIDPVIESMRAADALKPDPKIPEAWIYQPESWVVLKSKMDALGAEELEMAGLVRKDGGA